MTEKFMKEALKEAKKAFLIDEVPVGCVIVRDNKVIARGYNKRESKKNSLLHAEIIAINKACKKLNSWRLDDCDIYVTLEPCPMCSGAIIQSRIKGLFYGASDFKTGACGGVFNMFDYKFNHEVIVEKGIMLEECSNLIKDFFKNLRDNRKRDS